MKSQKKPTDSVTGVSAVIGVKKDAGKKSEEGASGTAVATGMAGWMMTGLAAAGIGIVIDRKRHKSDRK